MGDILHALPAVAALRAACPGWHIDWAVEPRWQPLLAADDDLPESLRCAQRPLVDGVIPAPTKQWGKAPFSLKTASEVLSLRRKLRAAGYDVVLDLQGSIKSAVIASFAGARRVIGTDAPRERPARWFYSEPVRTSGGHVIEQGLEIASAIAPERLAFTPPPLPVSRPAEQWCDALLGECGSAPLVLINPGAGWGAKCWPQERYGKVAAALAAEGCTVLVNAGPGEEELTKRVCDAAGGKARAVLCTIEQLIALTRRIALLIAGDTGPLHLACALGKPVLGIYGPTEPGRNGPYGTRSQVLRSTTSRRDHRRLKETEAGLMTIEADAVLRAAGELMNAGAGESQ